MTQPVRSMTGVASVEVASQVAGEGRFRVDMRSVNHRFLDLKVRLPRDLTAADGTARNFLQAKIGRGSVEVRVERLTDLASSGARPIQVNVELAKNYLNALRTLAAETGVSGEVDLVRLAQMPEVMGTSSNEVGSEEAWMRIQPALAAAVDALIAARETEGASLKNVLLGRVSELRKGIEWIRSKRSEGQAQIREKVRSKIQGVFELYPIDLVNVQAVLESRIAHELTLILDRTDVDEELVRFSGHLDHVQQVLSAGGAIGKKMEFLLQELNREVNTLGNKAQDVEIGGRVVQLKVMLEQMREQVLNLE